MRTRNQGTLITVLFFVVFFAHAKTLTKKKIPDIMEVTRIRPHPYPSSVKRKRRMRKLESGDIKVTISPHTLVA